MFTWQKKAARGQKPDPKAVAHFVVYNVLINETSRFGIPVEQLAGIKAGLPEAVQETFGAWGPFYIAWRLLERSGERYGSDFCADAKALVPACIEPIRGKVPDTGMIISYFRKIFDTIDETDREGELVEVNGYQVPVVARVALRLIGLEGGDIETRGQSWIELASALEDIHRLAEPMFDMALAQVAENKKL